MKFTQLKIGERFHYKNADYTKTGPLQAIADGSANPQLIRRSAIVQTSSGQNAAQPLEHTTTDLLRQAFGAYHSECKSILLAAGTDPDSDLLDQLEIKYQLLLKELEAVDLD
jgi:hypothetical protein